MVHTKIYVVECETPFFWYVGSTFRELYERIDEHEAKYGCKWTQRHGFRRMAMWADVPSYACSVLEDELTEWLMHEYGVHNVRGGNYVNCRADCYASEWWLPRSMRGNTHRTPNFFARSGGASSLRDVPSLHFRPVSQFPLELGRLVDAFQVFRRLQNSDHLNTEALPDAVLGGRPEQNEHVLPAELVAPALGAEQVPVVSVSPDHGQEDVNGIGDGLGKLDVNRTD